MYYSYGDAQKMRHMLKQSAEENGTSKEQMQHNSDSLNSMVSLTPVHMHSIHACILLVHALHGALSCGFSVRHHPDKNGTSKVQMQHNSDSLNSMVSTVFAECMPCMSVCSECMQCMAH